MSAGSRGSTGATAVEALGAEARRILEKVGAAGPRLRLTGSLAVQLRCPRFGHLAHFGREFHDIDFVAYRREGRQLRDLLGELGYAEDREVAVVSEGARAIFEHGESRTHIDVFFDRLDFCHLIPLDGRLEIDSHTLPLAELLLGKLQIVRINDKDLLDAVVLLLEHAFGEDDQAINLARIAHLSAEDWGLHRTTTLNLEKMSCFAATHPTLASEVRSRVLGQIEVLGARLRSEPKPLAWRLRAKLGDRVKWYRDVDDLR
jgi:hypothetical protein